MVRMRRDVPHNGYQALYEGVEVTAEGETSVVVAESNKVSLASALHVNAHFASVARRGSAALAPHKITWFTGNNKARTIDGKPLPDIAGWAIEQPDLDEVGLPEDFELHDAMEYLCEQGIAAPVIVLHQDDNGKPRPVRYWSLPTASFFVVCEGIPSKMEMLRDPELRWGVAYAWPHGRGSSLHFYAYIKELMDAGYRCGFFVRLSSYCTDRMLACLKVHERVLNVADDMRRRTGETEGVAYYAYALPVTTSKNTITAGKEVGKTKEIFYPVPRVPHRISVEYLAQVAITEDQALTLEEGQRVESMVAWSIQKSRRLLAGNDASEDNDVESLGGYVDMDGNPIEIDEPPF